MICEKHTFFAGPGRSRKSAREFMAQFRPVVFGIGQQLCSIEREDVLPWVCGKNRLGDCAGNLPREIQGSVLNPRAKESAPLIVPAQFHSRHVESFSEQHAPDRGARLYGRKKLPPECSQPDFLSARALLM